MSGSFANPYRPGAGHMPPHLAGRRRELDEFDRLLRQETILENLVLTGLRGVGKTVLLETFKPRAREAGWLWVGTDLSEAASISESNLAERLLADLSVIGSALTVEVPSPGHTAGFAPADAPPNRVPLTFATLKQVYEATPGLVEDKLKRVLHLVWSNLEPLVNKRVIFAYDEAQNLTDHADRDHFPLSLLLDVFQSVQKQGIPFMLVLTGLPTLFPKLVEARTFAERMFRVVTLSRLEEDESKEAILRPIEAAECPLTLRGESVDTIVQESGGYPYFIQFICREVFDVFIQQSAHGEPPAVPVEAIQRKLDEDFFAGRWSRVTDRQRQLLWVVALLENADDEFTIQELVAEGKKRLEKPFSASHANQILSSLATHGLIYKNRFGRYSFAVPLLGRFIRRTYGSSSRL